MIAILGFPSSILGPVFSWEGQEKGSRPLFPFPNPQA